MNRKLLFAGSLALLTNVTAWSAEHSPSPMPGHASEQMAVKADAGSGKVHEIESYVRAVESKASSYTRKEEKLAPAELKKVTDENWTKIHTYSDGRALKRMKLYPAAGSQKTEEFYYENDKPVFVFIEENGAGKENHDASARGDKYYFANGNLVAAMSADGKAMDIKSAEAKKMAEKLKKESQAFRAAAK